jgi:hypothetical protein
MSAVDRLGLQCLLAGAPKPRSSRIHKAKTRAASRAVRLRRCGPQSRVNSYGISFRVERMIGPRVCVSVVNSNSQKKYYYFSIDTKRRNSEKTWTICGNPAPSIFAYFIRLTNKHLDMFRNGTQLDGRDLPARVPGYWCSRNVNKS